MLNRDVWFEICKRISTEDLASCMLVCKTSSIAAKEVRNRRISILQTWKKNASKSRQLRFRTIAVRHAETTFGPSDHTVCRDYLDNSLKLLNAPFVLSALEISNLLDAYKGHGFEKEEQALCKTLLRIFYEALPERFSSEEYDLQDKLSKISVHLFTPAIMYLNFAKATKCKNEH